MTLCGCFVVVVRQTVANDYELDYSMVRYPKFEPTYFELYSKVFLIPVHCHWFLSYAYLNNYSKREMSSVLHSFDRLINCDNIKYMMATTFFLTSRWHVLTFIHFKYSINISGIHISIDLYKVLNYSEIYFLLSI